MCRCDEDQTAGSDDLIEISGPGARVETLLISSWIDHANERYDLDKLAFSHPSRVWQSPDYLFQCGSPQLKKKKTNKQTIGPQ